MSILDSLCLSYLHYSSEVMHVDKISSAAGLTLAATPEQLRLQHSAAASAPEQHKHAPEQARQSDDAIASARVEDMQIEGLNEHQRIVSCVTQLKKLKNSTNLSKRWSKSVA
ncbi:hypothetical protein CMV_029704 [Castanea mollissima]|uniref:Uncharacterized protein n=1 Tax=Castanea mollissima TaxID=60419 RepID=A0A8J4UZJ1_9ROSI|nr:hypothetical protein CMV_029704 [Castanea mollissima]